MESKKVLTRENKLTVELRETVKKNYKDLELSYDEVYYLDFEVDEDTGMINKNKKKVKHYTKDQAARNMKALKSVYLIAKGAAAPTEIINFRTKYHIAASTLSLILGFSKNTISNIENEGVTSLSSGRLIKMCLNNKDIMYQYIKVCDVIDKRKKDEFSDNLMQQRI
ncbi:MAG: transcriptional regulator [Bacteroidales bacterium]|nr:transcriptional regulator [Bacteroidales bacterium]